MSKIKKVNLLEVNKNRKEVDTQFQDRLEAIDEEYEEQQETKNVTEI